MESKIEVSINYSEKEIKQIVYYCINQVNKLWLVFPCLALVLIAILIDGIRNGFNERVYELLAIYLVIFLGFYSFFYLRVVNGYANFYKKRKGGIYTFTDTEVKVVGIEIQSICTWNIYKGAFEIPKAFLLTDENKFLYIFPKRCFANNEDIEEFRKLLGVKMKKFLKYI